MASEGDSNVGGYNSSDFNMPKWKKDLIERRKITTKTISGHLQISCPASAKFINSNLGLKGLYENIFSTEFFFYYKIALKKRYPIEKR